MTANLSGTSCSFSQSAQEAWGTAKTDDNVYGVLFEEVTGEAVLVNLKPRGEGGSTSIEISSEWDTEKTHAYAFASSANGQRTSATVSVAISKE